MQHVRWIVLDVDGTLTDGVLLYSEAGEESKAFHVADGLGIVMARAVGFQFAAVSGRDSRAAARRLAELGVTEILQGAGDKAVPLRALLARHHLRPEQIAYMGDDLNDLPAFGVVGVRIAPADAAQAVRDRADYVTPRPGGHGAVRDAVHEILRRQGRLDEAVAAYLSRVAGTPAGETAAQ